MQDISVFSLILSVLAVLVSLITYFMEQVNHDPILLRRSVIKYDSSRKVPKKILDNAINAAIHAPNHFLTEPWRFYYCGPKMKDKLFELNNDKRKQFESVPCWMVVTMASKYNLNHKLYQEEISACACSVQNFMLSLASEGVGSKWVTGALGIEETSILKLLDVDSTEKFLGVIWFGYPEKSLESQKPPERKLGKDMFKILE